MLKNDVLEVKDSVNSKIVCKCKENSEAELKDIETIKEEIIEIKQFILNNMQSSEKLNLQNGPNGSFYYLLQVRSSLLYPCSLEELVRLLWLLRSDHKWWVGDTDILKPRS